MKVILLQDIKGTGKKDAIIEVSDGYARNYLFPRKLAAEASSTNLNAIQRAKAADAHREDVRHKEAEELGKKLKGHMVQVSAKAGENGRLYGSITTQEIAEAIKNQHGVTVDKRRIELAEPVRALGDSAITVWLYPNVTTTMSLKVVAETKA